MYSTISNSLLRISHSINIAHPHAHPFGIGRRTSSVRSFIKKRRIPSGHTMNSFSIALYYPTNTQREALMRHADPNMVRHFMHGTERIPCGRSSPARREHGGSPRGASTDVSETVLVPARNTFLRKCRSCDRVLLRCGLVGALAAAHANKPRPGLLASGNIIDVPIYCSP